MLSKTVDNSGNSICRITEIKITAVTSLLVYSCSYISVCNTAQNGVLLNVNIISTTEYSQQLHASFINSSTSAER